MQDEKGHHIPQHHELLDLFDELTFREKIDRVMRGLKSSHDSGDYKYAKLQLIRLSAPIAAVFVPILALFMLMAFAALRPPPRPQVEVQILDPEALEELDDIDELMDEPIEPPEPLELDFTQDIPLPEVAQILAPAPTADFSPQPSTIDSVAIVKSPVILRGIYGSRSPGARGQALKQYGHGLGRVTEGAVIRALRWLRKHQEQNGSWTGSSGGGGGGHEAAAAFTGMALLTFLAHGEIPSSEEFGPTVERAIRWLIDNQGPDGSWARHYEHQIAAYAISEAYALTKIPMIKQAAERGTDIIIQGQNVSGGWNYPLRACDRDDTFVMAWCAQALKAAKMAGLENAGLDDCMRKAIDGFKKNWDPNTGGFGYATDKERLTTGASGLTGAGTLSMQFLGAGSRKETRMSLKYLAERRLAFNWEKATWRDVYYWYYDTQARFHSDEKTWKAWNRMFAIPLVKNQMVEKGAGVDGNDIGHWETTDDREGLVFNTALCALMLQVYYRYLPTYKPTAVKVNENLVLEDEVEIEITI